MNTDASVRSDHRLTTTRSDPCWSVFFRGSYPCWSVFFRGSLILLIRFFRGSCIGV